MSNFNQKDLDKLEKWGNKKAKAYWMANHHESRDPVPERTNSIKMKEFLNIKYVTKRFIGSEGEDSEEESKSQKKKKKKKKKYVSSSDSEEESSSAEEEVKKTVRKGKTRKLIKPPSSNKTEAKPKSRKKDKKKPVEKTSSSEEEKEEEPKIEKKEVVKEIPEDKEEEKVEKVEVPITPPANVTPLIDPIDEQRKATEELLDMNLGSAPMPASVPKHEDLNNDLLGAFGNDQLTAVP